MTEQDRSDWSLAVILSTLATVFCIFTIVLTIHLHVVEGRRCGDVEAQLQELREDNEKLRTEMRVHEDLFAAIYKGTKEEW